ERVDALGGGRRGLASPLGLALPLAPAGDGLTEAVPGLGLGDVADLGVDIADAVIERGGRQQQDLAAIPGPPPSFDLLLLGAGARAPADLAASREREAKSQDSSRPRGAVAEVVGLVEDDDVGGGDVLEVVDDVLASVRVAGDLPREAGHGQRADF